MPDVTRPEGAGPLSIDYSKLAFVDTETTGLDPDRHAIWEVAIIAEGEELSWLVELTDEDLAAADPVALDIGRFHERHPQGLRFTGPPASIVAAPYGIAKAVAYALEGRHVVGAIPSFDTERLARLLRRHDLEPTWHYHIIDVEALAVGWLAGSFDWSEGPPAGDKLTLPWKSEELSRAVGVEPEEFNKHTALGDARWAKAVYEAVVG